MTLRDDAWYVISVAGGAASAGLTWFFNSPLFGVVTGALVGGGLAMAVQSRTQKRIWRRELGPKNIDNIYGPLYREITGNLAKCKPTPFHSFEYLDNTEWRRILADYLHHFIEADLRKQLERYYRLVENYASSLGTVFNRVPQTIQSEASLAYGRRVQEIQYAGRIKPTNVYTTRINEAVMFREHPRKLLETMYRDFAWDEFFAIATIEIENMPNSWKQQNYEGPEELKRFNELFERLCKVVGELQSLKDVRKTLSELVSEGESAQASLVKLIREPWSM